MTSPVILWFRRDLRLADNPALSEAAQGGRVVIPVFIFEEDSPRTIGGAARWWLHHSLRALSRDLTGRGASLLLYRGKPAEILPRLAAATGARCVLWNRRIDPLEAARDHQVTSALVHAGIQVETFIGDTLFEPGTVRSQTGQPFRVFTPFWRNCCQKQPEPLRPLPAPDRLNGRADLPSARLEDWTDLPASPPWAEGLAAAWTPGEDAGRARLCDFIDEGLEGYGLTRDLPAQDGTSRLSPHLAWGEVSPRQIWHAAHNAGAHPGDGFLRELGWREFCQHGLDQFPHLPDHNQRPEFDGFPWREDPAQWQAFIAGATGYPIVDAGMRALWETGWMHNRVRMVVASFLVKDLLIPWQRGRAWFDDTLVDADTACNAAGWQWVAGCGSDSAPYFRVFNPVLQGEKFDPKGSYVRRWLPELAGLPDRYVHRPWEAPREVLDRAGLRLGANYPAPILDHDTARRRALAAFATLRGATPLSAPGFAACENSETPDR